MSDELVRVLRAKEVIIRHERTWPRSEDVRDMDMVPVYGPDPDCQAAAARIEALEAERDGWRAQAEATAREARACFDAQREIDEAWDHIGSRANKGTLSLPEQLASIFREEEAALAALAAVQTGEKQEEKITPAGNENSS